MIQSVQIRNFKSIVDLTMDLGRFNILIGENGCGKSNILEAIAFGAASSADKADYEFLGSRGIRVTNPEFMYSAFTNGNKKKAIELEIKDDKNNYEFQLEHDPNNIKKWKNIKSDKLTQFISIFFKTLYLGNEKSKNKFLAELGLDTKRSEEISKIFDLIRQDKIPNEFDTIMEASDFLANLAKNRVFFNPDITRFIIYSPEQSSLRRFEETTQMYPLGIRGEGLFQYLKELALDIINIKALDEIRENLTLLDWYDGFELPVTNMRNEYSLRIKDRYLNEKLQYFDQRSANEGFLYLLFYTTLFISRATPAFFAIDNIDASLNPKMCMQLTKNLTALAKKHKKQVIITTQNPAVLDGLNLEDDNQRLFVVRRNMEGHTIAQRIGYNPERRLKLSEVWTSGFIGGLPENF